MENWKLQLVVVAFCALVQSYQGFCFSADERGEPKDCPDELLKTSVADLMKRSEALQFYGLMGKRAGIKNPPRTDRRRNKGGMFVGLMGRSISSGESLTRRIPSAKSTALDVSEESNKRDSREEWAQLRYY